MEQRKVLCLITFLGDLGLCRHLLRPTRASSPFDGLIFFSVSPPELMTYALVDCVGIDLNIGTYHCFDLLIWPTSCRIALLGVSEDILSTPFQRVDSYFLCGSTGNNSHCYCIASGENCIAQSLVRVTEPEILMKLAVQGMLGGSADCFSAWEA